MCNQIIISIDFTHKLTLFEEFLPNPDRILGELFVVYNPV